MAKKAKSGDVREAASNFGAQDQQRKDDLRHFLRHALARFKIAEEHESKIRKESLDDFRFSIGEQWTADIKSQREADGRPCLVMDHLQQSIRQVTNEERQQRPSIQVNPAGDGGTRETADVFQGVVRHIEVQSDAEVAYDSAFEQMVRGGFAWLRVLIDWEKGRTFEQKIVIDHVRNPWTVYSDPAARKPDKSDAKWRFVVEDVPRDEYRVMYPDSEAASLEDFSSIGDNASEWAKKDAVRVAEYWHVEEEKVVIYELPDGSIVEKKDVPEGVQPVNEREYVEPRVVCSKINAIEKLEDDVEWPGSIIPLVPVYGTDFDVDGKRHVAGMVRNAKDPQRMYNYQCSAATEASALAPKAPYIGVKGQFASSESQWKSMNQKNFAYIEYDNVLLPGNTPAPRPERNVAEPPIQAMVLLMRAAGDDLKASIGIYDASLGAPGPEQSGRAILARQKQGDVATLNFSDNLARSIRCVGRILVELIPHVYARPRVQRIINPDQTTKNVAIFSSKASDYSPDEALSLIQEQQQGIELIYDLGAGEYDITVSVGPSYQTKRQEAVASIQAFVEAYPNLMQLAGDLLVGNMDWPYAHEIAKRLKKTIPPNLIDDQNQTPEERSALLEQQNNQLQQQMQELTALHQQAQQIIQTKTVEQNAKVEVERIHSTTQLALAKLDKETKLAVAEITTKAQDAAQRRKAETDVFLATHGAAHELAAGQTQPAQGKETPEEEAAEGQQGNKGGEQ